MRAVFTVGFELVMRNLLGVYVTGMFARERGGIVRGGMPRLPGHHNRQRAVSMGAVIDHSDLMQAAQAASVSTVGGESKWAVPAVRSAGKYEAVPRTRAVETRAIETTTMAARKTQKRRTAEATRVTASYVGLEEEGRRMTDAETFRNSCLGTRREEREMGAEALAYSRPEPGLGTPETSTSSSFSLSSSFFSLHTTTSSNNKHPG